MSVVYNDRERVYTLSGGKVSYVLGITQDGRLMNLYWGPKVPDGAIPLIMTDYSGFASFDPPPEFDEMKTIK